MKQNTIKGEWVGGTQSPKERREDLLKAHEEFLQMLADGWQIKSARVKRPRIQKEKKPRQVIVSLGGTWTLRMSFEDYQKRGDGLKITMRIY